MSEKALPQQIVRAGRKQVSTRIMVVTALVVGVTMIILGVVSVAEIYYSLPISNRYQVVYSGSQTVDQAGFVVACNPPLRRLRRATDLNVNLAEHWTCKDLANAIELEDGRRITLEVVLVDSDRNEYRRVLTRGGSETRSASFPDLPPRAHIREVRLYASEPVHCTKIGWANWSPM